MYLYIRDCVTRASYVVIMHVIEGASLNANPWIGCCLHGALWTSPAIAPAQPLCPDRTPPPASHTVENHQCSDEKLRHKTPIEQGTPSTEPVPRSPVTGNSGSWLWGLLFSGAIAERWAPHFIIGDEGVLTKRLLQNQCRQSRNPNRLQHPRDRSRPSRRRMSWLSLCLEGPVPAREPNARTWFRTLGLSI